MNLNIYPEDYKYIYVVIIYPQIKQQNLAFFHWWFVVNKYITQSASEGKS